MLLNLLTVLLVACSSMNWNEYVDNVNNYKIKYPDKWTKQSMPNGIAFLSPKENEKDMFQENVNLMLQDLSQQPMNLEQYTELTKKQVTDNLGASAIVSLKATTLAGQVAKELVYNMNYQGRSLKLKQYWFVKENTAYLYTYTAEPSKYDKYETTATELIRSFTFTK